MNGEKQKCKENIFRITSNKSIMSYEHSISIDSYNDRMQMYTERIRSTFIHALYDTMYKKLCTFTNVLYSMKDEILCF